METGRDGPESTCLPTGCTGALAHKLVQEYPRLQVTVFDLPEVIKLAGDFQTDAEPSERVHFVPGQCGVLACLLSVFGRPYLSPVWGEWGFPGGAVVRSQPAEAGDVGRSLGREDPLEEEVAPAPVFFPGKSSRQRSLRATVHGVSESWTRLSAHVCGLCGSCICVSVPECVSECAVP